MRFFKSILTILTQKEKVRLFALTFFNIAVSALDVVFLGLAVIVINFYIRNSSLPYLQFLPGFFADKNSIALISLFFILFGIKNLFAYFVSASNFKFIYGVASRLSCRNIKYYLRNNFSDYIHTDSAIHIRRVSHQPIEFATYILTNFQLMVSQAVLVLFIILAMLLYNASLFLLLLLLLVPAVVFMAWLLKKSLKQVRGSIKRTNELTLKNLKEALAGYVESNIYNRSDFFVDRYHRQQEHLNENICKQQALQALPSRLIEVFAILGFLVLILVNKWSAHHAAIDLLTIGVFIAAAYKIIPGVVRILNCAGQMKTYEFTLADLLAIANEPETEKVSPVTINAIRLDKIHFSYNGKPVLSGLNLEVKPGDFAGISGYSGRGKTTLINILLGFIEQQEGVVCFNNKIITTAERQHYWDRISYIKQQPFFIHDTVLKNITLAEGGHNEDKLKEALSLSGLESVLQEYVEGKYLIVNENGKNLSGGQRQRVMLARALYHDFDTLILDEPFGELDQESENDILVRLKSIAALGKMIILVTHNKTSLAFCNKMIYLDE